VNGWNKARAVEARGLAVLLPYLSEKSDGRLVVTSKGRLARYLQLEVGDVIFNSRDDAVWTAEIKVEEKHTGNLFLETWSNRNFASARSHAEHGSNVGWLFHTRADLLLYYFLDTDDLYTVDLFLLKRWAFGAGDRRGRIYTFPEIPQTKNNQMNETCGRIVDVRVLADVLGQGLRHCRVRQLSLPMLGGGEFAHA